MQKIGIVGHQRTIKIVIEIITNVFKDISLIPIPLNDMDTSKTVLYIKSNEQDLDGVLFTGIIPYNLLNTQIVSEKPWAYIRHAKERLVSALLEATIKYNFNISSISIDSYSETDVLSIYQQLNINTEQLNLYTADYPIYSQDFIEEIKSFHLHNYQSNNVSFCITGISSVYEYLRNKNVPCIILDPTKESVEKALTYLKDKNIYKEQSKGQIVVLAIERDLPDAHALIRENEYQLALESMKVSEEVYLFSQRIQAAVVERGLGKYLLFTTKYLFEIETEDLQKINIMTKPVMQRFGTLSIGIGYGDTAREAKYYANLGLLKAKKNGGNQAFKVEHNKYIGPITPSKPLSDSLANQIDGAYQRIATKSGISLNSIVKLQSIIDNQRNDTFTPSELASLFGVSHRSMNRIVEKLLDAGYAKIVGNNMRTSAGRPSRIVRLNFHISSS